MDNRSLLFCILCFISLPVAGQSTEQPDAEADARLEYMTTAAKSFSGSRDSDGVKIKPMEAPLLRWTNPYSDVKDGVFVGWVDDVGRPMAVAQIYLLPKSDGLWGIELQSLSQSPLTIKSSTVGPWKPKKPGVTWKVLSDKPVRFSKSEAVRLSQMRSLARRFRGDDDFEAKEQDSVLRLLPNPMVRYSDPANKIVDGALFALVHGTDPEMIIQLELRESGGEHRYHYALSPMTGYELRGFLDGAEVYHKPRKTRNTPTDIFWQQTLNQAASSTESKSLLERILDIF